MAIISIFILATCAEAATSRVRGERSANTMPETNPDYRNNAESSVDINQDIEANIPGSAQVHVIHSSENTIVTDTVESYFHTDMKLAQTKYYAIGYIKGFLDQDGAYVAVSYDYGDGDALEGVVFRSQGIKLVVGEDYINIFSDDGDENVVVDENTGRRRDNGDRDSSGDVGGNRPPDPKIKPASNFSDRPIVVLRPKARINLDQLAKSPAQFEFAKIKKSLQKMSETRAKALGEYTAATGRYYESMAAELNQVTDEGLRDTSAMKNFIAACGDGWIDAPAQREVVDRVVAELNLRAQEADASGDMRRIADSEKLLREKVIRPASAAASVKFDEATQHTQEAIEEIVSSEIALYYRASKGMIDMVINLPKAEEKVAGDENTR